jgi:signal transduction histidine kinase/HAMP domain-containing protein
VAARSFRHSIGTKIFVAFIAMGVLIGALGAYGYFVLSSSGDMVTGTYDGPLMSINYARAATVDFVQMEQAALRRQLEASGEHAATDKSIDDLTSTFFDDLDIAQQRLSANDELTVAKKIRSLVKIWQQKWKTARHVGIDPRLETLDRQILDQFDTLIELNADHSFVGRRKAVWQIGYFKYAILGVTSGALLLAFGVTLFLARGIMGPLSAAATAADRIARGEFQTPIPNAGKDETGILLKSMTVMQDNIREMVEREKARAESAEERLTNALETSNEGVLLVGPDGKVVVVNNTMRGFFPSVADKLMEGVDFAEISHFAKIDVVGDVDLPTPGELGIGRGPRSLGTAERQLVDGRWIRSSGSRTEDGGLIFFVSDFTAVKEREANFRRATEAAEAASAAKTRFLTNMSHELRTPLNAVIGFSEILTAELFGPLGNKRYTEYSADILRSGRHLLDVINSVLEISKHEAGKQRLDAVPVDMRTVLQDCAKMMAIQFETANIAFDFQQPQNSLFVAGDKAKLRQVLLNLLSNALKFTESGGQVTLSTRETAGAHVIEIADTGIGMSEDDVKVALTPFGQVDNRLERKYEGTGLGLPLAKSMTELHGGMLEIKSARGAGTKISVYLPKASEDAIPRAVAS